MAAEGGIVPDVPAGGDLVVVADRGMAGMEAGEEGTTGGLADWTPRVGLRETHSLRRRSIQVRGMDLVLPIASQFAVSEIVRKDQDDVGKGIERGQCFKGKILAVHSQRSGLVGRASMASRRGRNPGGKGSMRVIIGPAIAP